MTHVALDASALLALLLDEPGADVVARRLEDAVISTVNMAEVVSHYARFGASAEAIRTMLSPLPLIQVPVDEEVAFDAGMMRDAGRAAGLSLGDRICLAMAKRRGIPALTADRIWADVAERIGVSVELVR